MTGGQARTSSSPLGHPTVDSWDYRFGGCHCCAWFYFFPHFPSKSRGWGEGKENRVPKGAVQTDLSSVGEEDPWPGRVFEPAQGPEPGVRTEWRGGSGARLGVPLAARPRCARPLPRRRAPSPVARDQGTPQLDFFVQFQQSSEEVGPFVPLFIDCVNIAKRRRRSGGPSPPPTGSRERKAPAHDLSTQRGSRPPAPASRSPPPPPPERCQPRHVSARENRRPGAPRCLPGFAKAAAVSLTRAPSWWAPAVAQASRTAWAPRPSPPSGSPWVPGLWVCSPVFPVSALFLPPSSECHRPALGVCAPLGLAWEPGAGLVSGASAFPGLEMPVFAGPRTVGWGREAEGCGVDRSSSRGRPAERGKRGGAVARPRRRAPQTPSPLRRCSERGAGSLTASRTAGHQAVFRPGPQWRGGDIRFEELLEAGSVTKTFELFFKTRGRK